MITVLFIIYLVGFFVVFIKLLIEGMKVEDRITLGDILLTAIVSLGSWILVAMSLAGRLSDVVIWRRKKEN